MLKKLTLTMLVLTQIACTNTTPTESTQQVENPLALLFGESKQVDHKELDKHPLGTLQNPVRVNGPAGQRDYLSRLICENNEQVSAFSRLGSSGIGSFGNITDIYEIICDTEKGAITYSIYMDMYHANYVETRPAKGFIGLRPHKAQ